MATSILGIPITPSGLAKGLGYTLGAFQVLNGGLFIFQPALSGYNFGFASPSMAQTAPHNPFIGVLGGRAIAAGAGMLAMSYYHCDRAFALMLMASPLTGFVDAFYVRRFANEQSDQEVKRKAMNSAMGHAGLTGGLMAIGAWIWTHL